MSGLKGYGVLNDHEICERLHDRSLKITEKSGKTEYDVIKLEETGRYVAPPNSLLDAHGCKLRIGRIFSYRTGKWTREDETDGHEITLRPGEAIVVESRERIQMPPDLMAFVTSLARVSLRGLSHVATTIHPGWGSEKREDKSESGVLRVALHNVISSRVTVKIGEPICRLVFVRCAKPEYHGAPPSSEVFNDLLERFIPERKRERRRRRVGLSFGWASVVGAVVFTGLLAWQSPEFAGIPLAGGALIFTAMQTLGRR